MFLKKLIKKMKVRWLWKWFLTLAIVIFAFRNFYFKILQSMTTLLKSATIIDTSSPYHQQKKDILIIDGKINKIANFIPKKAEYNTVLLDNLHISVGWFDSSVSFGEPGFEERETIKNGFKYSC